MTIATVAGLAALAGSQSCLPGGANLRKNRILGNYLGVDISQAWHMSAVVFSLQNTTAIATLTLLPILVAVGLWSTVAFSMGRVMGAEPRSQFLTSDKCFSS